MTFTGNWLPVESIYIIIIVLIYFLQGPVLILRVPTAITNLNPAQHILKIALRNLLVRCQPTNAVARSLGRRLCHHLGRPDLN